MEPPQQITGKFLGHICELPPKIKFMMEKKKTITYAYHFWIPERSPQSTLTRTTASKRVPCECGQFYIVAIGESDKRTSLEHEEGRNYTLEHSRTHLDEPSQDLLGRGRDSPDGRVLLPKKVLGSRKHQTKICI